MYLWSVTWTEWVLSSTFFFTQDVNVSFENAWSGHWSGFSHNQTSVHLLSGQTSYQNTNVVTSLSVIESFIEGFNTHDLRFHFASVSVKLYFITNFDFSLLDSTWSYSTSTSDVVSTFDCHHEWLIDGSGCNWDQLIHCVQESLDFGFSQFWVDVLNWWDGRSSDESSLLWIILVFFEQLFQLFFDQIDHFSVLDHIHLV